MGHLKYSNLYLPTKSYVSQSQILNREWNKKTSFDFGLPTKRLPSPIWLFHRPQKSLIRVWFYPANFAPVIPHCPLLFGLHWFSYSRQFDRWCLSEVTILICFGKLVKEVRCKIIPPKPICLTKEIFLSGLSLLNFSSPSLHACLFRRHDVVIREPQPCPRKLTLAQLCLPIVMYWVFPPT